MLVCHFEFGKTEFGTGALYKFKMCQSGFYTIGFGTTQEFNTSRKKVAGLKDIRNSCG